MIRYVPCRWLQTSSRLLIEPVSKKQKPADDNFKHKLVTCQAQWTCCAEKPTQLLKKNPRVVIVGAGMAGLAAACRLQSAGIQDITIVEALDRPGGRIHSCDFAHSHVDLGCEEIYGTNIANPAFNVAVMEKLLGEVRHDCPLDGPYYAPGGLVIFDVRKPFEMFKSAIEETKRIFSSPKKSKTSVKEYISHKLKQNEETYSDQSDFIMMVVNGLQNESRARWGDDLSNVSADLFGSYIIIPNGIARIKNGTSHLADPFLSIVKNKIKYNKPVQSIRWSTKFMKESKRGSVLCCDGNEFHCDFVICTVSLGVLKAQAETLFSPALPKAKLDAITNLSFGHIDKIYLEYDKPFWAPGEGIFRVAWNPQELEKREDWLKGLGSIEEVSNNVLKVSVGGREAAWSEGCTDRSIAEELTLFLRKLLGDPSLPCPKRMIRSRWSSDIYFQGAVSYLGLASSVEDQCTLMAPLPKTAPPVLLFAGEATAPGHFSTVHGAIISGYREADRIIQSCQMEIPPSSG